MRSSVFCSDMLLMLVYYVIFSEWPIVPGMKEISWNFTVLISTFVKIWNCRFLRRDQKLTGLATCLPREHTWLIIWMAVTSGQDLHATGRTSDQLQCALRSLFRCNCCIMCSSEIIFNEWFQKQVSKTQVRVSCLHEPVSFKINFGIVTCVFYQKFVAYQKYYLRLTTI